MILGLDLSLTSTGWAAVDRAGAHIPGLIPDTKGHIADRLQAWQHTLANILNCYQPAHIIVEDLGGNQRGAFELGMVWGRFWDEIERSRYFQRDTVTLVNAATLKMFATGRGNAGKDQMLAEAIRRLGYEGHDHNEADALFLAQLGAHLHGYPNLIPLPAAHLKALGKVKKAA